LQSVHALDFQCSPAYGLVCFDCCVCAEERKVMISPWTARGQERCVFVLLCMWSLGMLLITSVLL